VLDRADRTAEHIDALVGDVRTAMRVNAGELRTAVRNLRIASQSFKELGRELRDSPSRLLVSRPPKGRKLP
jgi:hypothetical protein